MNTVYTPTWTVEGVSSPVVVVPLIKSQPDVCRTFAGLAEHQVGHIAPQLKGRVHHQPHGAQRQVAGPVYNLVGQVTLVPLPVCWNIDAECRRRDECVSNSFSFSRVKNLDNQRNHSQKRGSLTAP